MENLFALLKEYIAKNPRNFGDGESVLEVLYECYSESRPYDNAQIKADFGTLYRAMNGTPLMEMDKIIDPVCDLCRDYEKSAFLDGIRIGILLEQELSGNR